MEIYIHAPKKNTLHQIFTMKREIIYLKFHDIYLSLIYRTKLTGDRKKSRKKTKEVGIYKCVFY